MRSRLRLLAEAVAIGAGTAVALALLPPWRGVVLAASAFGVLLVGAAEAVARTWAIGWRRDSPFEHALEVGSERPDRPADLVRLERAMGLRAYSGRDFDHYVRPTLAGLVQYRLQARRGIDPEREPDAARAALSPRLRGLLTPLGPGEHTATRVEAAAVGAMIDEIEAL